MAQLDPSDRMRIIIEGKKREEQGYLSIRKQAIDLSISRKAVALWWGRRDELDQIGALLPRWKGNSGRPVHKAFSTHEEKEKSIDVGEHQTDAARKLGCSLRTLRNHTHKTVNWRFPPRKDVGHTDAVSRKRLAFVRECLTPSGHRRQKIHDTKWLDHKWVNLYGHNRSHQRQARRGFFSKKNRSLFLYYIFVISTLFSEQQRFFCLLMYTKKTRLEETDATCASYAAQPESDVNVRSEPLRRRR